MILSDTLIFLGIDFSQAKMVNPADVFEGTLIRDKHGPYWGIIDDFMCKHSNLKFDFEKKVVICKATLFDSSYTLLKNDWVVSSYAGISDEQIAMRVKNYPYMQGYKVGFVFIIDKMDKTKGMIVMQGVYINLTDNSVLKIIKATGAPNGFGYSMYWANGVDAAYAYFNPANHNYLQRIRHYFKKNKG